MLVAVGTILWVIASGLLHIRGELLFDLPEGAFSPSWDFVAGLGGAALIGIYGYGGYNNICFLGGEVRNPGRNIPFAVIASIVLVALLYIFLNTTILGVVHWRDAMGSQHVVSDFMEIVQGPWAAQALTYLVLGASAASVFALLLGYSRIPYAAARDGRFFAVFAKLHPVKRFPHVSLLTLGLVSTVFCFFELGDIIQTLIVIQIVIQVLGQIVAVTLIRKYRPDIRRPFQMWGYPIPSLAATVLWLLVLVSTKGFIMVLGLLVLALGVALYMLRAGLAGECRSTAQRLADRDLLSGLDLVQDRGFGLRASGLAPPRPACGFPSRNGAPARSAKGSFRRSGPRAAAAGLPLGRSLGPPGRGDSRPSRQGESSGTDSRRRYRSRKAPGRSRCC